MDLATYTDVEARWRPLSSAEQAVAGTLLGDAYDLLLAEFSDLESRVDAGTLSNETVTRIAAAMVKRAMLNPAGVTEGSETAGPFAHSQKYANPTGDVYLTGAERTALAGPGRRSFVGWLA